MQIYVLILTKAKVNLI